MLVAVNEDSFLNIMLLQVKSPKPKEIVPVYDFVLLSDQTGIRLLKETELPIEHTRFHPCYNFGEQLFL